MKATIVKRLLASSLIVCMTVSMTVGCGSSDSGDNSGDSDSSKSSSSDSTESGYTVLTDENGDVYDLGGIHVIIRDWWSSTEETEPENAYEEARQEYLDWIQETYNFTITEEAISVWGDVPSDFINYATTGGDEYYVFCLYTGTELLAAMNSELMYDLSTLDCLDFSEDKWKSGVHEQYSFGDSIYAMRGIDPEPRAGIFFNKRLLEEAGIDPDSLYEMQENGTWTWDAFEELCSQVQRDTDNDGVIDVYGMTNFMTTFYCSAVYSNGGDFIGKNDDGTYYNALETDETLEALNWAAEMVSNYEMIYPDDAEWDYTYTAFYNGEAVFSCMEVYNASTISESMTDEYGFVCFPMGPESDDYTNVYEDNVYVIPGCYDEDKAWAIAFAYNLYTDPVPGYEDYNATLADYYSDFCDTESVDYTVARMLENGRVTYHNMISGISLGEDMQWWAFDTSNTPAQVAESIRNTWESYLNTANSQ